MSGSIPISLGNLSNLEALDLSFNQLSGSIPSSLGALSNLVNLWLRENQLSGSIPISLGNLSNLQVLSLSGGNDELCAPNDEAFSGVVEEHRRAALDWPDVHGGRGAAEACG